MDRLREIVGVRVRELREQIIREERTIGTWERQTAEYVAPAEYTITSDWHYCYLHGVWGNPGQTVYLRTEVSLPHEWRDGYVALRLRTGGEGLLRLDGHPYHGIDDNRDYIALPPATYGTGVLRLNLELKAGDYWQWRNESAVGHDAFLLSESRLVLIDKEIEAAFHDFRVVLDTAEAVSDAYLREILLAGAAEALDLVDFRDISRSEAVNELAAARKRLRAIGAAHAVGRHPATFHYTGHSHIDLAWLWPLRETARKVGRTYATVIRLMEEYPDYYFNISQPPLLEYTKEYYPELYRKLATLVEEGRIEPVGGTWVEHDANIPSGESLVRQCLYGQRFFEQEFGTRCSVGWLPDVFGYAWSLPQIYKSAGLKYFVTSKISWNDTNSFPYGSFLWEGIDGSRILTHFVCGSYNANLQPQQTLQLWEDYPSKHAYPRVLSAFGWGDGGGGPTRTMIETIRRHNQTPGLPKSKIGRIEEFFSEMQESANDLPVWNGELYLELCRGTYTSQAANKKWNRTLEGLLHDAELATTMARFLGSTVPQSALRSAWKDLLLNQFHDILPGSSIDEVHSESHAMCRRSAEAVSIIRDAAFLTIARSIQFESDEAAIVVFNTLPWDRTGIVVVDLPDDVDVTRVELRDGQGRPVPTATTPDSLRFLARRVPSMGYAGYTLHSSATSAGQSDLEAGECNPTGSIEVAYQDSRIIVTTSFYKAVLDADGTLLSLWDTACGREVIAPDGVFNRLLFFEDKPERYEAWNIDVKYRDRVWQPTVSKALHITALDDLCVAMSVELTYGGSSFDQTITFYAHSPVVEISHVVNWVERKTLCKVGFAADIHTHRATYEIPYGSIERPTHTNTTWEQAQFEVPGFRWADLSEGDYGLSVLNDSKYGWDVCDGVLRLTLLRGSEYPAKEADVGRHEFRYAILPHRGAVLKSTVRRAQEFNLPMHARWSSPESRIGKLPSELSFFRIEGIPVILDAVKQAEEDDDIILRFYEPSGARGTAKLICYAPIVSAWETNILEDRVKELAKGEQEVSLSFRPYELKSVRIRPASE